MEMLIVRHPTTVRYRSLSRVRYLADNNFFCLTLTGPGTGITLYIAHQNDNVNATITIDGNPKSTTTQTLSGGQPVELYNITLYTFQSLALGSHEATVQLLSYNGGNSSLWFDYAAVYQTQFAPK